MELRHKSVCMYLARMRFAGNGVLWYVVYGIWMENKN